jgi:hypothetical protein
MSAASLIQPDGSTGMSWGFGETKSRRFGESDSGASSSTSTLRVIGQEESIRTRAANASVRWDDREFERAPRTLLWRIRLDVLRDPARRGHWTERLFSKVLEGTPARGRLVYETLREFADPQDVLVNALVLYHRYGDSEPLIVGAGLLEDLGARSWPVLSAYVRTARSECAHFVPAIARLDDVAAGERLRALEILAQARDPDLRWMVYESLDAFPFESTIPVLRTLAEGGLAEDSAQFAAVERLRDNVESR